MYICIIHDFKKNNNNNLRMEKVFFHDGLEKFSPVYMMTHITIYVHYLNKVIKLIK